MLIDKGELWNNIAIRANYSNAEPLKAYASVLAEITNAEPVDAIPVPWIKAYIEKLYDRLNLARQIESEAVAKELLETIGVVENLIHDYHGG